MKKLLPLAFSLVFATSPCFAGKSTIDMTLGLTQPLFKDLVTDLGAALSYKAIAPAESMGLLGIDVSVEISKTSMETQAMNTVTGGAFGSSLYIPKLHVHKGLPFGIDVGAFLSKDYTGNVQNMGAELRYSLLDGSTVMPAIALRGSYTILSGVDHLDMKTMGLDISISKGFLMATPYAGVGKVRYIGSSDLFNEETVDVNKTFVGLNFNLGLVNFAAELDKTGDNATTSAKIGFRF